MPSNAPWFEDDVLWEKIEHHMFSKSRLESTAVEVDQLLELAGILRGSSVLDLCCGIGRHSIELARRGMKVTAVDRTRLYLDRAEEAARAAEVDIEFIESDMREFSRPGSFDLIINMLTSFGYFENPDDDIRVIENMSMSLSDGGCIVIQTMGKEILARIFQSNSWDEGEDGTLFLQRRKVAQDWGWMDNQWIIINGTDRFEVDVNHRIFSAVELKILLTKHGFKTAEAYGGTNGSAYDQTARLLLVLGRK